MKRMENNEEKDKPLIFECVIGNCGGFLTMHVLLKFFLHVVVVATTNMSYFYNIYISFSTH